MEVTQPNRTASIPHSAPRSLIDLIWLLVVALAVLVMRLLLTETHLDENDLRM